MKVMRDLGPEADNQLPYFIPTYQSSDFMKDYFHGNDGEKGGTE